MSKEIVKIEIKSHDDANRSLKKFQRLCEKYGIKREYKKRKEYKKPSLVLKEKNEAAQKKRLKLERKKSRFSRRY
ncbi:30S ribosomal protein S21 [Bacteriovorax sp. DB6_IX]|uniref:30S ribosomal protein S21 n=1 Tax=Bacteriovorax sp. DB6_IX TaxID=1353530 RepID=UPI00038A5117|nr:30S ribosomal protein S21 [Bacteriovorax sp. DB6_IX]EQC51760.1 ribosomal protein S21 [Bacteriovorax sp. DB6_IX]